MGELEEERRLRLVAQQNVESIQAARRRAERAVLEANEALEQRSAELERQREWFEVTLASIGDAVVTTDTGGAVTFLNRAAETMTGWSGGDACGLPLEDVFQVFDEHTGKRLESIIEPVSRPGATPDLVSRYVLRTRTGDDIAIEGNMAPIRSRGGAVAGAVVVFRDVSERRLREKELRRSAQLLSDFFEHAPVGLHWVGADGTILRANQTELDLLGYDREDYVGHHISEFHADPPVIEDILERLRCGESLQAYEARLRCKDGTIRHVLISSNVLWEDGKFVHTRCFTRDVTAQKNAEIALREGDRRKDEFLATLAHELRNPLAPVRHAAEIASSNCATEAQKRWSHGVITRQVRNMSLLLEDLLDVSRITNGRLELRTEMTELAPVVDAAVETARPLIEEKQHELVVELPAERIVFAADPLRLAQMLANLLTNAAKYTDPGGTIRVRVIADTREITITVGDSGIGMTREALAGIFEMFSQVRSREDRSEGGLGIGLALVKGLVELHGGTVEARSAGAGLGSEFTVRLPRHSIAARKSAPMDVQPVVLRFGRRVLIADDNRDAAESLGALLRLDGHEVTVVYSGRDAISEFGSRSPEVAILDIGMPGFDGYDVARHVRAQSQGSAVTLVAVTGWGQESDRAKALSAGFDHHFTKPVEPDQLSRVLQSVARRPSS